MSFFPKSLYARLSLVYLVLLLALGVILILVTANSYRRVLAEADQKLNRDLAANLAKEFSPFVRADSLNYDGIGDTMHYLMVMNPRLEIYLLDEAGSVLAYFADPERIVRDAVDVEPIRAFLDGAPQPIFGDDPRRAGGAKPFSVAPIELDQDRTGYLYVILTGEQYDSALQMVQNSAIARVTFFGVATVLIFAALVGLVLFAFMTKRLRSVTRVVQRFKSGDFADRVTVRGGDELGELSEAFNQMADTIEANVEDLKHKDDLRRELVANVSHDLRSPLASIRGYVETVLIKGENLSADERERFLQIILDNTNVLGDLAGELFELSKLDGLQVQPKREPFSIAELTQDVVVKFKPRADELDVALEANLPKTLPMVFADIGMIERVISNVLDNALRYTPEHGRVHVDLTGSDDSVTVSVSDTGHGIPHSEIPRVTERFYRVDKSRARESGGSGLGLAIATRILELHESSLSIESAVGVGTTVSFSLGCRNGER